MTQTIKERLEELKKPKWDYEKSDYPYYVKKDKENVAFNAGVDACLPLLEEERKQSLISFQEAIEAVGLEHIEDWVKVQLEALTPPTK
jgi:hypothetical protein